MIKVRNRSSPVDAVFGESAEWVWDEDSHQLTTLNGENVVSVRLIRQDETGARFYSYKYVDSSGVVHFSHVEWERVDS